MRPVVFSGSFITRDKGCGDSGRHDFREAERLTSDRPWNAERHSRETLPKSGILLMPVFFWPAALVLGRVVDWLAS